MEIQVVIGVAVVIALVALRLFAARRAASGQPQFVWLVFAPTLFIGIAMLWVSAQVLERAPLSPSSSRSWPSSTYGSWSG